MKFTKLSQIRANPENPRRITKADIEKAAKSITEFPQMMKLRPVVVDDTGMALGGNVRYHAMVSLGMEEIPEGWVVCGDELSEEQKIEFIIKDNGSYGTNDWGMIANEWSHLPLIDWGVDIPTHWADCTNPQQDKPSNDPDPDPAPITCPACGHKW